MLAPVDSGPIIGLLGLGEAGGLIRAGLREAGAAVRGYDPLPQTEPDVAGPAEAVEGADVVLSLTTAAHALEAARSAAGALRPGGLYADANTAGRPLKRTVAAVVALTGARFADVALMAPVPGRGLCTPALASGDGAEAFAALMTPLGMPVRVAGPEPGDAAARKLLRSVAWKGIAAVAIEAMAAAEAAGCADWMRDEIAALLSGDDGAATLDRMLHGSRRHAVRREHEMRDVAELLRELGVEPRVSEASRAWLAELGRS